MTELEMMQRAKMYMDKLSMGIDPISSTALPNDTALNNARLAKCFAYVSGVLGRVIDNGGEVQRYEKKAPFSATPEQLAALRPFSESVPISYLVDRINEAVSSPEMCKLSANHVTNWLLDKGFLVKETRADGKNRRVPSDSGLHLGLSTRLVNGLKGDYLQVLYEPAAQQFVLDHLTAILEERKKTDR